MQKLVLGANITVSYWSTPFPGGSTSTLSNLTVIALGASYIEALDSGSNTLILTWNRIQSVTIN